VIYYGLNKLGKVIHMMYITGDTHIPVDIGKLSAKRFPRQKNMTKDDYVIICGDFGGIWDGSSEESYWMKWLRSKNFTTLFVDGNHENFQMISELPVIEFCGGKAHKAGNGIYHLMRGEIYTICDKKLFTFGGGSSHDKSFRTEGKNWWKEELPTEGEMSNGIKNLSKENYSVDYVITHSAPSSIQKMIAATYEENVLTDFLDEIKNLLSYSKWFFGHYHKDMEIDKKHTATFQKIHYI